MSSNKGSSGSKKRKGNDEALLESLVFGGSAPAAKREKLAAPLEEEGGSSKGGEKKGKKKEGKEPAAAWSDAHDADVVVSLDSVDRIKKLKKSTEEVTITGSEYEARLRDRFVQSYGSAKWADKIGKAAADSDDDEEDDVDDIFKRTGSLIGGGGSLKADSLDIKRVKDLNVNCQSNGVVQSISWHPSGELALTAAFDKKLNLFSVDGKKNNKVQSVFFSDMPIYTAAFKGDGREVILSGRRKFFYTYDVVGGNITKVSSIPNREEKSWESFKISPDGRLIAFLGNDGYIVLVSGDTKQWVNNFKINGSVRAVDFTSDSQYIYAVGGDGEVYKFDIRSKKCLHRHVDEGSLCGTSISVGRSGSLYAVGSDSGVVNVYDSSVVVGGGRNPKPLKTIMNLTTPVHEVQFSSDDAMLTLSSHSTKDTMRICHSESMTVFGNWPTSNTPLHYVSTSSFSPNNGYLAIGNDKGNVLLYRLKHYGKA